VPTQKKSKGGEGGTTAHGREECVVVQEMEIVAVVQVMEQGDAVVVQNPTKPTMETIINDSPIRVTRRLVTEGKQKHVVYAPKTCTERLLFHLQSTCNAIGRWYNFTGRSAISIILKQDDTS
jgi:hypothetical protein